jgi:uncharacterized sulfatase
MRNYCYHRFLFILGLLLAFACGARADLAPMSNSVHEQFVIPHRASIIFIQCHGLGYGDLSCYGQTNFQTPNLDKLAAGGIRFEHYTPGDTNAAIAQAALLTGAKPAPGATTVAQLLQNVGYKTGLIGEWTVPVEPWKQGFEEFLGFLNPDKGTNYYADSIWRHTPHAFFNESQNQWMPWKPEYGPNNGGSEMIYNNTGGKKGRYLPDLMLVTLVQNFIRINQPDRFNGFRPFFLLVNLPAPRTASPGHDEFPVPTDAPYSDEPWPQAAKNRAALITQLDGDIGRLLEQLNKFRMTNNVAIFFTSNAEPEKFADPGLGFFRAPADVQNEGKRDWSAPMIVYWPGSVAPGQISDFSWSAQDFLPTAAQIGYARAPKEISGHSILPLLLGRAMPAQP